MSESRQNNAMQTNHNPNGGLGVPAGATVYYIEDRKLTAKPAVKENGEYAEFKLVLTHGKVLFLISPSAADITQKHHGHCFLAAVLANIAEHMPYKLMESMVDNQDNTVTVRFFHQGNPFYIRVDKTEFVDLRNPAHQVHAGAFWFSMYLKAYGAFLIQIQPGVEQHVLDLTSGGTAKAVLAHITGKEVKSLNMFPLGEQVRSVMTKEIGNDNFQSYIAQRKEEIDRLKESQTIPNNIKDYISLNALLPQIIIPQLLDCPAVDLAKLSVEMLVPFIENLEKLTSKQYTSFDKQKITANEVKTKQDSLKKFLQLLHAIVTQYENVMECVKQGVIPPGFEKNVAETINAGLDLGAIVYLSSKPAQIINGEKEAPTKNGLVHGHAYEIRDKCVHDAKTTYRLTHPWSIYNTRYNREENRYQSVKGEKNLVQFNAESKENFGNIIPQQAGSLPAVDSLGSQKFIGSEVGVEYIIDNFSSIEFVFFSPQEILINQLKVLLDYAALINQYDNDPQKNIIEKLINDCHGILRGEFSDEQKLKLFILKIRAYNQKCLDTNIQRNNPILNEMVAATNDLYQKTSDGQELSLTDYELAQRFVSKINVDVTNSVVGLFAVLNEMKKNNSNVEQVLQGSSSSLASKCRQIAQGQCDVGGKREKVKQQAKKMVGFFSNGTPEVRSELKTEKTKELNNHLERYETWVDNTKMRTQGTKFNNVSSLSAGIRHS